MRYKMIMIHLKRPSTQIQRINKPRICAYIAYTATIFIQFKIQYNFHATSIMDHDGEQF